MAVGMIAVAGSIDSGDACLFASPVQIPDHFENHLCLVAIGNIVHRAREVIFHVIVPGEKGRHLKEMGLDPGGWLSKVSPLAMDPECR